MLPDDRRASALINSSASSTTRTFQRSGLVAPRSHHWSSAVTTCIR
jgi:hypothetical protein